MEGTTTKTRVPAVWADLCRFVCRFAPALTVNQDAMRNIGVFADLKNRILRVTVVFDDENGLVWNTGARKL